jgi:hypothetical protein
MIATLTTDGILEGTRGEYSLRQIANHLNESPQNSAVIHLTKDWYILRGAGGGLDNFYYGEMPAENPNDAEGGSLTAGLAILKVLEEQRLERRRQSKEIK